MHEVTVKVENQKLKRNKYQVHIKCEHIKKQGLVIDKFINTVIQANPLHCFQNIKLLNKSN